MERENASKIIKGVGGKAFPNDYNWVCKECNYENRSFESQCANCIWLARGQTISDRSTT